MSDDTEAPLPDGTYDAFVVDLDEPTEPGGAIRLHVTIVAGAHKGEVVEIAATNLAGSFVDLVGMPATITVEGGQPAISIDD